MHYPEKKGYYKYKLFFYFTFSCPILLNNRRLDKMLRILRKKKIFFLLGNKFAVYLHPLSKTMVCSSRG